MDLKKPHVKISDTSKFVAYLRSFSDIAGAEEVYKILQVLDPTDAQKSAGLDYERFHWLAPITEARYKSITSELNAIRPAQILELASGFATRFFETVNPSTKLFLDSDLPDLIELKRNVIEKLGTTLNIPSELRVFPLDAMSTQSWTTLSDTLQPNEPVAIVNEGLFQYFERDELTRVAKIIFEVLKKNGGTWITPDFSTSEQYQRYYHYSDDMKKLSAARTEATGRNLLDYAFSSTSEIEKYFHELGFKVERKPMMTGAFEIRSASRLNVNFEEINNFFGPYLNLWILSV